MNKKFLLLLTLLCSASAAQANGLFEDRPWQFATPGETQTKAYIEDLIKKQKAGYYDQGAFLNKTFNLGCSSDATTTGNEFTPDVVTNVATPTGISDSDVSATTVGNEAVTASDSGDSQRDQSNSGSELGATANGNDIINNADNQTITANNNDVNNANDQNVNGSELAANTAGNELCNVTIYD